MKVSLRDVKTLEDFQRSIAPALERAIADPVLVHGQRVEAMFESLIVSLGAFHLIKSEDGGRLHAATDMIAPDFRIVLPDGAHWLVEVKNVHEIDPLRQRREILNSVYHKKLRAYADATGAQLKLAIYWSRWSVWTLVSPDRLANEAGELDLDMMTAFKSNELGRLGDRTVGTRPPLCVRIVFDPDKSNTIQADGTARVTIKTSQVLCDDVELTDKVDKQIALILIQYGRWRETEVQPTIENDRLKWIDFEYRPEERSNEGFEIVGTLSGMFAQYYRDQTVADGQVIQILAPLKPDWFAPLVNRNRKSPELPLWLFELQPSYPDIKQ